MTKWSSANMPPQKGKSFVVTGPTGLGYETGLALARAGARVILAGRNESKGASAVRRIAALTQISDIRFELLDLADLASIRDFAQRINDAGAPLDTLINNAGVMAVSPRQETKDGFELQFGTNHLGHFMLTGLLLPALRQAASPRVVTVSSGASMAGKINFDDLQAMNGYSPEKAYYQAKLANVMFALELQRRSEQAGWGILSIASHPGASKTDLLENGPGNVGQWYWLNKLLPQQSAAMGALPTLYAATMEDVKPGDYFGPTGFLNLVGPPGRNKIAPAALKTEDCVRLWDMSETLTGVRYDA